MLKRNSISKNKKNYSNKKTMRNLYGGSAKAPDIGVFFSKMGNKFKDVASSSKTWASTNTGKFSGAIGAVLISAAGIYGGMKHMTRSSTERKLKLLVTKIEEIKKNPEEFTNLNDELKNDREIVLELMKINPEIWHYIPIELKEKASFKRKLIKEGIKIPDSKDKRGKKFKKSSNSDDEEEEEMESDYE